MDGLEPRAAVRLNLGAGDFEIAGFRGLDATRGDTIFPLGYADASVDEIRASHVLEHFSHRDVFAVLCDWYRALRPGGRIRIAVPDFREIARAYLAGEDVDAQAYVMGGHADARDVHGCLFDHDTLCHVLEQAGFAVDGTWVSEIADCAAMAISLNIAARKPAGIAGLADKAQALLEAPADPSSAPDWDARPIVGAMPKTLATMSSPRLGFNDFWDAAIAALLPFGIQPVRTTGAYWDQCMSRGLEDRIAEGAELIITLDYDTLFRASDVARMLRIMTNRPDIDALSSLQMNRDGQTPLFTVRDDDWNIIKVFDRDSFRPETKRIHTAHFGLTIFRAAAFADLARPWLQSQPDDAGRWGPRRKDADMRFWRLWHEAGKTLYLANRVAVGHADISVIWPDESLRGILQTAHAWRENGKPKGAWT